jgi:hypothetical protein
MQHAIAVTFFGFFPKKFRPRRQLRSTRTLAHHEGLRGQKRPAHQAFQAAAICIFVCIGRVEKDEIEWTTGVSTALDEALRLRRLDPSAFLEAEALELSYQVASEGSRTLDESRLLRTTRQCFDSQGPTASEEVEHSSADHLALNAIEHGSTHPTRTGPKALYPLGEREELSPLELSAHDPEHDTQVAQLPRSAKTRPSPG